MPLLKRKAFEKSTASEYLRDDDEVFHCEITDEIFKDYEEYCERIILVNSMVWSCEMTGKNNLTYAEALESEKAARRQLKDFPMELRIPILYLAVKTNRSSFAEMSEDIFNYVRERYFVGETVEACLEGDLWREAHVMSVTSQKQQPGSKAMLPASSYLYEVEQLNEEDPSAAGQIGTAPHDRVRRRKGVYTRDKNRLFLKQFVQQANGIIGIKQTALDKYNIAKVNFDQLFTGSPPEFPSSKKLIKNSLSPPTSKNQTKPNSASKLNKSAKKPSPDKKGKQQSMDNFVKKTDKASALPSASKTKPPADPAAKKSAQELAEKMRRAEDQMRQRKEEEKAKKKEKTARLQAYLKEWQKVKDDLDLEDHKVLPKGTPVNIEGIPQSLVGDFLSVMEFVHVYSDVLKTKDVFHNELDLETFRKCLVEKEHAGVFSDLVQMFLTTIFSLQEDEAEEHNESGGIQESTEVQKLDTDMGTTRAMELATTASKWSHTYLATPLSKLPLDPTTVSEVLRLHLLSSGSAAGARCATWRYHQRGGYSSRDDPGLRLRLAHPSILRALHSHHVHELPLGRLVYTCDVTTWRYSSRDDPGLRLRLAHPSILRALHSHHVHELPLGRLVYTCDVTTWRYSSRDDPGLRLRLAHPSILRALHSHHVHELPLEDKFLVLQCLMNQILSYATVRDIIEEKLEELRNTKQALRTLTINERKREMQLVAARQELKKEAAAKKEELKLTGEEAKALEEETKVAIEKLGKESELKKQEYEKKFKELHAELFDYASYLGSDRAFRRYWVNQRVPGLFVEAGTEPRGPCRLKPVLPAPASPAPTDTLAYVTKLFESERASSDKENDSGPNSRGSSPKKPLSSVNGLANKPGVEPQRLADLCVCTGDAATCTPHGKVDRPSWVVYHTEEQLDALIEALNKRGARESDLRHSLENDRQLLKEYLRKCPLHLLDTNAPAPLLPQTRHRKVAVSLEVPRDCSLAEALELALRDHILELEEKIHHGCLGALQVKDREAWRGTLMLRGYDKQASFLTWGPAQRYRDDCHLPGGELRLPNGIDTTDTPIAENKYRDPGCYLEPARVNGAAMATAAMATAGVVRGLASALLQVEQAIHHKYIRRPLGLDDKERKEREAKNKPIELDALQRWEVSLMECRSFAQVVLHLFTLDSSVAWSASILNASCRLCRRKADPDNMLLCDGCNKGHHLYCLKPKLSHPSGRPDNMLLCDGCHKGHHLYCLKPKLSKVPAGDWFCEQCKPKERTPRKKRKLFSDEEIEDVLDENSDSEDSGLDVGVCGACGSGGRLACVCRVCSSRYHLECATPRPARAARRWTCATCLQPARGVVWKLCGSCGSGGRLACVCRVCSSRYHLECATPRPARAARRWTCATCLQPARETSSRRCAAAALDTIHHYTRALHASSTDESDDSEYNTALVKLKPRGSRQNSHSPLPQLKKSRKSKEETANTSSSSRRSKNSLTNGNHEERSGRKRTRRGSPQLHEEELQQLLADALKHKDCWPFYEPVSTEEVPDYLSVVSRPMDFSTVQQQLLGGHYDSDAQVLADVAQVFVNCYIYNKDTHPVARAGARLEKYLNKRCSELGLPPLPDTDVTDAEVTDTAPAAPKRAKLK